MTAIELRAHGDATPEQRAELHKLIATKAVTKEWIRRFFQDIAYAKGLDRGAANAALIYLRRLADKAAQPVYATAEQDNELRALIRTRVVPGPIAAAYLEHLNAGTLPWTDADRAISEWQRLPLRAHIAPDDQRGHGPSSNAPDGYFALTASDGRTRAYRVYRQGGRRVVDQIFGDRPSQRRRVRGQQVGQILRAIAASPHLAAKLYGEVRKRCSECNRALNNPRQPGYPYGYGEDCWIALGRPKPPAAELAEATR